MDQEYYVSDGKVSGGNGGAIFFGIVIGILFTILLVVLSLEVPPEVKVSKAALVFSKIIFALFAIGGNIPIAVLGQKIARKIQSAKSALLGDSNRVLISKGSSLTIIIRRYIGAIIFSVVYNMIFLYLLLFLLGFIR